MSDETIPVVEKLCARCGATIDVALFRSGRPRKYCADCRKKMHYVYEKEYRIRKKQRAMQVNA